MASIFSWEITFKINTNNSKFIAFQNENFFRSGLKNNKFLTSLTKESQVKKKNINEYKLRKREKGIRTYEQCPNNFVMIFSDRFLKYKTNII